jgi:hypothetical protein
MSSTGSGKEMAIFFIGIGVPSLVPVRHLISFAGGFWVFLDVHAISKLAHTSKLLRRNAARGFPEPVYAALA